jgi:N-acetylmuramoyl-L-alanine amidase
MKRTQTGCKNPLRFYWPNALASALAGAFGCVVAFSVTAATLVRDVRLAATTDSTRLVLDLSAPVATRVFTLSDPERLVIDLPETQMSVDELPEGRGQIKALRSGPRERGIRLVIDLAGPVEERHFNVEPSDDLGHRFVVDLRPASHSSVAGNAPEIEPSPGDKGWEKPVRVVKSIDAQQGDVAKGRDIVVAIDAGHGGEDPGAIGRRKTREKDVTLAIARKLKALIDAEPGMRAVLTRDKDVFVPLRERIARSRQANMFISIHADAVADRSVSGSSVYVLSSKGASNEAARLLADRENAADLIGGVKLDDRDNVLASVLLDLSQGASMSASIEAGGMMLRQLDQVGEVLHSDVKQAGFVVLKSPDIPSMLIETAFISNPTEEAKLANAAHQQRLAAAIMNGVRSYFYQNPLPGTLIAELKSKQRGLSDGAVNPSVLAGSP